MSRGTFDIHADAFEPLPFTTTSSPCFTKHTNMSLDEIQRESLLPVIQEGIDFYKHELECAWYDHRRISEIAEQSYRGRDAPDQNEEDFMTVRPGAPVRAPSDPINWDHYELTAEGIARLKRAQEEWDEDVRQMSIELKDAYKRESEAEAALEELYQLRELMLYRSAINRRSPALLAWWRAHRR